ncbi:hypothetical protein Syun_006901 [Stephania yunnanensis]|uniref:Uncharacterized protein n=1 Tax=Stephania yunnanensis TaxID=152371 RepID=A0AAP0L029_9MAGN
MVTRIGMMDAAYFVGRTEILAWINSTIHLNLSKVIESIRCSILDYTYCRHLRRVMTTPR